MGQKDYNFEASPALWKVVFSEKQEQNSSYYKLEGAIHTTGGEKKLLVWSAWAL